MGAEIISLQKRMPLVHVLPQGSTLADFVAVSRSNPAVRNVSFYVLSGPEETSSDCPGMKYLPLYSKAIGYDQQQRALVEQSPLYLGRIAFSLSDTNFEQPPGLSAIKPLEDLRTYAREGAVYAAQHGFEVKSYLRFKPLEAMQEICRISPGQAKEYPILAEPSVIYL